VNTKRNKVIVCIENGMSVEDTVKKTGASKAYVYSLRHEIKKKLRKKTPAISPVPAQKDAEDKPDMVNSPAHYRVGGIEVIDFIEIKKLNYHLGNVVKYVCRSEHKGEQLQDLLKAQWYLSRQIEKLKDK
jgi:hypothetical protein